MQAHRGAALPAMAGRITTRPTGNRRRLPPSELAQAAAWQQASSATGQLSGAECCHVAGRAPTFGAAQLQSWVQVTPT